MTPRKGGCGALFGPSPDYNGSYRKALVVPYIGRACDKSHQSPFPWLDWGSPHDKPLHGGDRTSPLDHGGAFPPTLPCRNRTM